MTASALLVLTLLGCVERPPVTIAPTASQRAAAIQRQVDVLSQSERFTGRAVGYSGSKSEAYGAFEALLEVAEDADLEGLLSDPSPVVRLYAFWGLLRRGYDQEVLLARLPGQAETVVTQYGCIGRQQTVGQAALGLSPT